MFKFFIVGDVLFLIFFGYMLGVGVLGFGGIVVSKIDLRVGVF